MVRTRSVRMKQVTRSDGVLKSKTKTPKQKQIQKGRQQSIRQKYNFQLYGGDTPSAAYA